MVIAVNLPQGAAIAALVYFSWQHNGLAVGLVVAVVTLLGMLYSIILSQLG